MSQDVACKSRPSSVTSSKMHSCTTDRVSPSASRSMASLLPYIRRNRQPMTDTDVFSPWTPSKVLSNVQPRTSRRESRPSTPLAFTSRNMQESTRTRASSAEIEPMRPVEVWAPSNSHRKNVWSGLSGLLPVWSRTIAPHRSVQPSDRKRTGCDDEPVAWISPRTTIAAPPPPRTSTPGPISSVDPAGTTTSPVMR
jgi:hypothetical protein